MAIENIKMRRIAREIQEWIFLGIQDGMEIREDFNGYIINIRWNYNI
jgi:hypothetical protein